MNLGENIYKYRTAQNRSQTDLANLLEVSRQSVSKWENNTAIPDLDKLINMSRIFDVTLDELVFGTTPPQKKEISAEPSFTMPPLRFIVGISLLIFGMIFFLLSVFWGDHLYFGEAFGELFSAVIVMFSLSLVATNNHGVLSICAVIYLIYCVVCFGILNVTSLTNYLFTFIASMIILIWFIVAGLNATKEN